MFSITPTKPIRFSLSPYRILEVEFKNIFAQTNVQHKHLQYTNCISELHCEYQQTNKFILFYLLIPPLSYINRQQSSSIRNGPEANKWISQFLYMSFQLNCFSVSSCKASHRAFIWRQQTFHCFPFRAFNKIKK